MHIQLKLGQIKISEIAAAMQALFLLPNGAADTEIGSITDDIKEIGENTLYIAGADNSLAEMMAAEKNGAAAVLSTEEKEQGEKLHIPSLVCEDVQIALWMLAKTYIQRQAHKTLILTGAKGKTKTGEFIFSVLEEGYRVCKATDIPGGIDSEIAALFELKPNDDFLLLEIKPGNAKEVERVTKRVVYDLAVVTDYPSELGGAVNGDMLAQPRGNAVVIAKESDRKDLSAYADCLQTVSDGESGDLRAENIRVKNGKTVFDLVCTDTVISDAEIAFTDKESLYAALFAAKIGLLCGICPEKIRSGLKNYHTTESKVHICTVGTVTLITDASSLTAESMKSGLETLCAVADRHEGSRRIALLGDIRDFGQNTRLLHENMGVFVVEKKIDMLFTIGVAAEHIGDGARRAGMAPESVFGNIEIFSPEESVKAVAAQLGHGDVLLVRIGRAGLAGEIIEGIKTEILNRNL